jgi:hypothetical protein
MKYGIVEILTLAILCCVPPIVLAGIVVAILLLNKRLNQSSWIRKILAVFTGVLVDLGGTNIVAGIYAILIAIKLSADLAKQNLPPAEIQAKLLSEINQSSIGQSIPMIVFGLLLSILGGYIAGKIARHREVVYGLATGIGVLLVSATLTLLLRLPTEIKGPIWQVGLILFANIGSTTLGGYLASLQRKRKQAKLMAKSIEMPA